MKLLELIVASGKEKVVIAIREAGPVRLKAIVMTTFTTLIVIVRLAFFPEIGMYGHSPILFHPHFTFQIYNFL